MQSIQALDVRLSRTAPLRCELTLDQIKQLATEAACGEAVVLLFVDADLDALAEQSAGLVVRRATKNPGKQLSCYFTKSVGVVSVNASYTVAGQALRGVRSLLETLKRSRRSALCLVGLPPQTFAELQLRAVFSPEGSVEAEGKEQDSIRHLEMILSAGSSLESVPERLLKSFVGVSPLAQIVRRLILCAARTEIPVLIEGESGTGKEIVARQIHENSARKKGTFIVVNCGAISPALFESELFGHEKGAFTGAINKKDGLWTLADKGTLFLDEIGDLPLDHQVKVLRALDRSGFYAVGSISEIKSDARIITATNRDLAAMVKAGIFREDLYYRLFSFRIRTYPLRQHPEDIPMLAKHFWRKIVPSEPAPLSDEALNELKAWRWPGNARELRAFLANTYAFACGQPVTPELIRNVFRDRLGPQVSLLGTQDR